jgi:hypothetical protein
MRINRGKYAVSIGGAEARNLERNIATLVEWLMNNSLLKWNYHLRDAASGISELNYRY